MLMLRLVRNGYRYTLLDVARKSGVPQTKLSLLERGIIAPTDKERARIARVFNADPDRLFAEVVPETLGKAEQMGVTV